MPLFIVKSPREPGKSWLLGPYPEAKLENIRAAAQIHSARSKNTAELVWRCDDKLPVVLYAYDKGVVTFPKGTPGNRDSKRGRDVFSCVHSSGGSCALPANMTGENAVKGRRKALNPPCPVKVQEVDRREVARQQRQEKPRRPRKQLSPAPPSAAVIDERPFSLPQEPVQPQPVKRSIDAHELNRMLPMNLFDKNELTKLSQSYQQKNPSGDPILAIVLAKVELLRRTKSHDPKKAGRETIIGLKKSVPPPSKRTA
jgi:hypothetical protein